MHGARRDQHTLYRIVHSTPKGCCYISCSFFLIPFLSFLSSFHFYWIDIICIVYVYPLQSFRWCQWLERHEEIARQPFEKAFLLQENSSKVRSLGVQVVYNAAYFCGCNSRNLLELRSRYLSTCRRCSTMHSSTEEAGSGYSAIVSQQHDSTVAQKCQCMLSPLWVMGRWLNPCGSWNVCAWLFLNKVWKMHDRKMISCTTVVFSKQKAEPYIGMSEFELVRPNYLSRNSTADPVPLFRPLRSQPQ